MITVFADCHLMGDAFSPAAAEVATGLAFDDKVEPGDGQPHGEAELRLGDPEPGEDFYALDAPLLRALAEHLPALRAAGATDIRLNFYVEHDGQCNLEMSPSWLRAIGALKVDVTMTTYQAD